MRCDTVTLRGGSPNVARDPLDSLDQAKSSADRQDLQLIEADIVQFTQAMKAWDDECFSEHN